MYEQLAVTNYQAETKAAFRRRVARIYGGVLELTTSGAGTTTTVVCAGLADYFPEDDSLAGVFIYDVVNEAWRRVQDNGWNATSTTATVGRAYGSAPGDAAAIEVYQRYSPREIDDALRMACSECYPDLAVLITDESLVAGDDVLTPHTTETASRYTYVIPSTIRDLEPTLGGRVSWQVNTSDATYPWAGVYSWLVRTHAGIQTLQINEPVPAGRSIRLEGRGIIPYPPRDSDLLAMPEDALQLLAYKTAALLWRPSPLGASASREADTYFSDRYEGLYQANKNAWGTIVRSAPLRDNNTSVRSATQLGENSGVDGAG